MVRTVLKMYYKGEWRVTHDDSISTNPYRVYHMWNEQTEYGIRKHRKLLEKYGDMESCLHCISQQLTGHAWRMTDQKVDRLY